MPIQNHLQRALAERVLATDASDVGHAAIHVTLAEMHEHAAASALNERLAPFEHSKAWRMFALQGNVGFPPKSDIERPAPVKERARLV